MNSFLLVTAYLLLSLRGKNTPDTRKHLHMFDIVLVRFGLSYWICHMLCAWYVTLVCYMFANMQFWKPFLAKKTLLFLDSFPMSHSRLRLHLCSDSTWDWRWMKVANICNKYQVKKERIRAEYQSRVRNAIRTYDQRRHWTPESRAKFTRLDPHIFFAFESDCDDSLDMEMTRLEEGMSMELHVLNCDQNKEITRFMHPYQGLASFVVFARFWETTS